MDLLPFDDAYKIVLAQAFETGHESVTFTDSIDRILREDIVCDMDMPPFNKATVDGYACRRIDLSDELELMETISAGTPPRNELRKGQCSKIMTGAAVPEGADMIFMVEDSDVTPGGKVRFTGSSSKDNISPMGEDIRIGDTLLRQGRLVKPQDIAIMALAGYSTVKVSKRPVVAVLSSGNELVEPWEKPGTSQIRNTNSYQLMAQVKRAGADGIYLGIARDDEDSTFDMLRLAIDRSDVVLISGGVSMGDFDFVPSVMEKAGIRILFSRVNIQPGKPTTFGVHKKALVFGLPGNPVSSFIQFELLVRPLLSEMMGYKLIPIIADLPMEADYSRRSADRMGLIPVRITAEGRVLPVEYHGSAHISAFANATGIIILQEGVKSVGKGEIVSVRQI